jgi:glycosyltransferase involved in cell wall biosynthesis
VKSPAVSVILTVFERTQFVSVAIKSVLQQTFLDYEIVVSDDSDSGSIRSLCDKFQQDGRLRYRANTIRLGAPLNIRAAIESARGKYIAILNDDDCWEPTFLERVVSFLEESSDRVLAFCDHWIMDEQGRIDFAETDANTIRYGRAELALGEIGDNYKLIFEKNGVPLAMGSVFRKDALDTELLTAELAGAYDFWISCALAATGRKFYYVPERLTRYRVHGGSETARKAADKNLPQIYIFKQLIARNWFPPMQGLLRRRLADAYFRCGRDLLAHHESRRAIGMLVTSFRTAPHWKAVAALGLAGCPAFIRPRI